MRKVSYVGVLFQYGVHLFHQFITGKCGLESNLCDVTLVILDLHKEDTMEKEKRKGQISSHLTDSHYKAENELFFIS